MSLHRQITKTVMQYSATEARGDTARRQQIIAAMLSGMTLTARYLAANEGGDITPQLFEKVATDVGQELGFEFGAMKPVE